VNFFEYTILKKGKCAVAKRYIVTLSDEEQKAIDALAHKGKIAARRLARANILRLAHAQRTDAVIAETLHVSLATIARVREKFVMGGLDFALQEDPRSGAPHKLDGKQEAFLVALTCSTPPQGHVCWTMQLLADKLLALKVIEQPVSDEMIRLTLKKTISSLGYARRGVSRLSVPNSSGEWKMCSTSMPSRIIQPFRWSALMNDRIN